MTRKTSLLITGWLLLTSLFMLSCQDIADDDHYSAPSWLRGNAWQVLEGDGNHKMFLKAVELTDYKPIVNGQSILTIMAPDDDAWQKFLQEQGYASVEDMNEKAPQALKKTVGFHLMYYAYDWNNLVNYRPSEGDGASAEQKEANAGLWYKHPHAVRTIWKTCAESSMALTRLSPFITTSDSFPFFQTSSLRRKALAPRRTMSISSRRANGLCRMTDSRLPTQA